MMKSLVHRAPIGLYVLVLALNSCVALRAQSEDRRGRPLQMASLHPGIAWQRISPTVQKPEGPVLYQILFRSSAKPGFVPKIDGNFTLTNSLVFEDNAGIHISGLAIAPTGAITLCCGQSFGAGGAGGTVTNIATGTGLTGGPISTSGTISIANGGVTTAQIGSGAATNGQVLTANGSGGAVWQNLPAASSSWALAGNAGTGCATSPCTNFLGTTDSSALEVHIMGNRAFRIEPATDGQAALGFSPNIIGGFSGNTVIGPGTAGATIAGGGAVSGQETLVNTVSASFGTVGGGYSNTASGIGSTVAGGADNTASGGNSFSTVGGGTTNIARGLYSTVSGGIQNTASGDRASVGGGGGNTASGGNSFVGNGFANVASGTYSIIGGGGQNFSTGSVSTVSGGAVNIAGGDYSAVAGGLRNTTNGVGSFAAGQYTTDSNFSGVFLWGDNSTHISQTLMTATADNQFLARATGGVIFYTKSDLSTGVSVAAGGGSWSSLSDRNVKANFAPIDGRQILAQVLAMPVTTWNYKSQAASIRHIGPMAQDFHAAFQVGEDDKHITEIDEGGVAFAAIQGLNQKLENNVEQLQAQLKTKDAQISAQQKQIEALEQQVRVMMTRVEAVEKTSRKNARGRTKLTPFGSVYGL